MITDPNYYYGEFVVSIVLGFIFGSTIDNIKNALYIFIFASIVFSLYYQNLEDPSILSDLSIVNNQIQLIVILAVSIIVPMAVGGAGTILGQKIRHPSS